MEKSKALEVPKQESKQKKNNKSQINYEILGNY